MIRARCCCPPTRASLGTLSSVRRSWALKDLLIERGVLRRLGHRSKRSRRPIFSTSRASSSQPSEPRTESADIDVVLRWFGAQRPPARLVHLDDGTQIATERLAAAAMALGAELLAAAQANLTIERGLA